MTESNQRKCPECDMLIPEASPGGLCPRCFFGGTAGEQSEPDPDATGPGDPENPSGRDSPSREELLTPPAGAAEFALSPDELDRLFPGFEILSLLGAGGMGAVYRARQPRLDRIVALKVLCCAPEMYDAFALRFEREAQLLAKLQHPHIVTLFDFGEIPDGPDGRPVFYFLMEYIEDGSLEARIRSGDEIRPREAFRLVSETCAALAFAHSRGVLHRDIKPANLLLDAEGKIRVADFGVAKILADEDAPLVTGLTMTGTTMGTPHYMAPELWDDSSAVDARADLYSLGVVFYQLLTGERPAGVFEAPSRLVEVERMVDDVVFKALEKNPERRYEDAEAMRADVERIAKRHHQRVKRRRGKVALVTGITVAILVGLGVAGWKTGRLEFGSGEAGQSSPLESEIVTSSAEPTGVTVDVEQAPPLFVRAEPGLLRSWSASSSGVPVFELTEAEGIRDFVQVALRRAGKWNEPGRWLGLRENGDLIDSEEGRIATHVRAIVTTGDRQTSEASAYLTFDHFLHALPIDDDSGPDPIEIPAVRDLAVVKDGWDRHVYLVRENGVLEYRFWGEGKNDAHREPDRAWRLVPETASRGIVEVTANRQTVVARREDGSFAAWTDHGPVEVPREIVSLSVRHSRLLGVTGTGKVFGYGAGNSNEWEQAKSYEENSTTQIVRIFGGDDFPVFETVEGGKLLSPGDVQTRPFLEQFEAPLARLQTDQFACFLRQNDTNFRGGMIWIESTATEDLFPDLSALPHGRLRHAGTGPNAESIDFSRAGEITDFVDVVGSPDFWVGLRANSETISSDGTQDATGIAKLCGSYHTHAVLIDESGGLVFREGKTPSLPAAMQGVRFVDALVSHRHGIALDKSGRAHVFGESYKKDFDDGLGAGGYSTPKWPAPPEEALTDVQSIAVAHTHAATLKKDGSLRVFGWQGLLELPTEVRSKSFTQIASSPDHLCLLDTEGRIWRFGLARNPYPDNPMRGSAGNLLRMSQETATAVGDESWRDEDGRWHSREKEVDELLQQHLPGDVPHFARKWRFSGRHNVSLLWVEPVDANPERRISLFNGTNLDGWISDPEGAFTVEDGAIVTTGEKGRLFYQGQGDSIPSWSDFELEMEVKIGDKANSGIFFHTNPGENGRDHALQAQLAGSHADPEKTGSIWKVQKVNHSGVEDGTWFRYSLRVEGNEVTVKVNGEEVNRWRQPENWNPRPPSRRLGSGTIALEGYAGKVWFRDVHLRPLGEELESVASPLDRRATPGRLTGEWRNEDGPLALDLSKAEDITDFVQVGLRLQHDGEWFGLRANGELVAHDQGVIASEVRALLPAGGAEGKHPEAYLKESGELVSLSQWVKEENRNLGGFPGLRDIALSRFNPEPGYGDAYHALLVEGNGGLRYEVLGSEIGGERWREPPAEARSEVAEVMMNEFLAVARKQSGEFVAWYPEGALHLPADTRSLSILRNMMLRVDGNGRLWRSPFLDGEASEAEWRGMPWHREVLSVQAPGGFPRVRLENGSYEFEPVLVQRIGRMGWDGLSEAMEAFRGRNPDSFIVDLQAGDNSFRFGFLSIEPEPAGDAAPPVHDVPNALTSMRERGGRLRSWAAGHEVLGTELAEGITDFVRLDGPLYPGSDRWLAIRSGGPSVTPLPDFARSGELISLDTHLGVLRSGEVVKAWQESRRILPGNAVDGGYAGHGVQFELFRNRNGTVTLNRAFPDGAWFERDGDRILEILDRVQDAIKIDTGPSKGIVLRRSGEVIAWKEDGLWLPDPPITDAVDVATAGNMWAAVRADGSVHVESGNAGAVLPPENLPEVYAIRANGIVLAAQLADGSWRAWGGSGGSRLIERINTLGPAVDLRFFSLPHGRDDALLWIEPADK